MILHLVFGWENIIKREVFIFISLNSINNTDSLIFLDIKITFLTIKLLKNLDYDAKT